MSYYTLPSIHLDSSESRLLILINKQISPSFQYLESQSNNPRMNKENDILDNNIIVSKTLHSYLIKAKENIGKYVFEWDKFKKYTNPYEFIHSIIPGTNYSISSLKPLSRSFYKMIEICNLLNILDDLPGSINSFHLAEGPGGFIEALVRLRNNTNDTYYGMTLIQDTDINVPGWKKTNNFLLKNKNVIIEKGHDHRGDITNPDNLMYCYNKYNGTMNIITADGGFDFTSDFNNQENSMVKLILCQIAFAISIQKKGGTFIIKFFDTFSKLSVDMIYLLSLLYEEVNYVKPNTSRYGNSEKYIVCKNFKLGPISTYNIMLKLYTTIKILNDGHELVSLFKFKLPLYFINKIEEYNAIFGQQQLENISSTINLIITHSSSNKNIHDKLETIKKNNINKCINWCKLNNIPYTKELQPNNIFWTGKNKK